jgi:hypothetical protein
MTRQTKPEIVNDPESIAKQIFAKYGPSDSEEIGTILIELALRSRAKRAINKAVSGTVDSIANAIKNVVKRGI